MKGLRDLSASVGVYKTGINSICSCQIRVYRRPRSRVYQLGDVDVG